MKFIKEWGIVCFIQSNIHSSAWDKLFVKNYEIDSNYLFTLQSIAYERKKINCEYFPWSATTTRLLVTEPAKKKKKQYQSIKNRWCFVKLWKYHEPEK